MFEGKYSKYIIEDVCKSGADAGHPELTAPRIGLGRHFKEVEIDYGFGWSTIDTPFTMVKQPHVHDFDQFLVFAGGDPLHMDDFRGAVAELYLGDEMEKYVITKPVVVYIKSGLVHCPLIFTKIEKPIMFQEIVLSAKYSRTDLPKK